MPGLNSSIYRFSDVEVHERELHIRRNGDVLTSAVHTGIITEEDSLADRLERLFEQLVGTTLLGTGAGGTR